MLYDLIFPELRDKRWGYVNYGIEAEANPFQNPNPLLNPATCEAWKIRLHEKFGIDCSFGGWMEDRSSLWYGSYLLPGAAWHLGLDFTVPAGSMVHLPCSAVLHGAIHNPDQSFGWGGKAIFRLNDHFVILAHIDLIGLVPGERYKQGDQIGTVAPSTSNGGWDPHLHLQIVGPGINPEIVDGYSALYEHVRLDFPDPAMFFDEKFDRREQ